METRNDIAREQQIPAAGHVKRRIANKSEGMAWKWNVCSGISLQCLAIFWMHWTMHSQSTGIESDNFLVDVREWFRIHLNVGSVGSEWRGGVWKNVLRSSNMWVLSLQMHSGSMLRCRESCQVSASQSFASAPAPADLSLMIFKWTGGSQTSMRIVSGEMKSTICCSTNQRNGTAVPSV